MRTFETRGVQLTQVSAWTVRVATILLLACTPWWYGSVTWQAQSLIIAYGFLLTLLMVLHAIISYASGDKRVGPNWLSWTLFGMGCFALLQAQSRYDWLSPDVPPSVEMQQWALGLRLPPASISEGLIEIDAAQLPTETRDAIDSGLETLPEEDRTLAISVQPDITRAASASLFLCALLVWIGGSVFCQREAMPVLLLSLTVVGFAVAVVGIAGSFSSNASNWLGLNKAGSFSTFVSKNSAGAYFNIAIAATLGLIYWSTHRSWSNTAQRSSRREHMPWKQRLIEASQDFVAHLDTMQVAAWIGLGALVLGLLRSGCRGAAVAAMAAIIGSILISLPGKRSLSAAFGSFLVIGVCITMMLFLQVDERSPTVLNSLGEIDWASEMRGGRFYVWSVSVDAARFYGWLGSGLGTFHFASLPFHHPSSSGWYYHAESIFAETLVTLGYFGLIAILAAILLCYRQLRHIYVSERFRTFVPIQLAGCYLLISQSVHGVVDFALILPALYVPAAILMGAAIGSVSESYRVVNKIKAKRGGLSSINVKTDGSGEHGIVTRLMILGAVSMSMVCMAALVFGRESAVSLAAAEAIEKSFEREDQLPLEERSTARIESFIDLTVELGASLKSTNASPHLMRLLADAICFDGRMQHWATRPEQADASAFWNQTSPFVIRIGLDRAPENLREQLLSEIGGDNRENGFERANAYYARAQALSPLDWRALWGRIITAHDRTPAELARFAPVIQRVCNHLPQMLTSSSILFSEQLDDSAKKTLWADAIRTNPSASLEVGRVMASLYADGSVPVELFAPKTPILYSLARNVFASTLFPETHQWLLDRALEVGENDATLPAKGKYLYLARISKEAGNRDLELKYLKLHLMSNREDELALIQLIELHIKSEDWEGAKDVLRNIRAEDIQNSKIKQLEAQINRDH